MPRPRRLILLPLTALALVAAGCGQDEKAKITGAQADKLTASLDRAESALRDGQCGTARAAAQAGIQKVQALKGNVDQELRSNLAEGFDHLDGRIAAECNKPDETATPSATATDEPSPTETPSPTATSSPTPSPTATASPSPTATVAPTTTPDSGTGGTGTGSDEDSGGSSTP